MLGRNHQTKKSPFLQPELSQHKEVAQVVRMLLVEPVAESVGKLVERAVVAPVVSSVLF